MRVATCAAAFAALIFSASTGLAQSWSFGVGIGVGPDPHYYGPPPGWYGPPPRSYHYHGPPARYYEEQPWVILGPAPAPGEVSPDAVFDALEAAGYREFGPMAQRGAVYRVRAVNPEGDLVELEISAYSGDIERELILGESRRPPPAARGAAPAAGERDPLVIY